TAPPGSRRTRPCATFRRPYPRTPAPGWAAAAEPPTPPAGRTRTTATTAAVDPGPTAPGSAAARPPSMPVRRRPPPRYVGATPAANGDRPRDDAPRSAYPGPPLLVGNAPESAALQQAISRPINITTP